MTIAICIANESSSQKPPPQASRHCRGPARPTVRPSTTVTSVRRQAIENESGTKRAETRARRSATRGSRGVIGRTLPETGSGGAWRLTAPRRRSSIAARCPARGAGAPSYSRSSSRLRPCCPRPAPTTVTAATGGPTAAIRAAPASRRCRDIHAGNVARLRRAWTYHTGDFEPDLPAGGRPTAFETTPLAIDGRSYLSTPSGRVVALDGDSGREVWRFDPPPRAADAKPQRGAHRGVSYWEGRLPAGRARRIFYGTPDGRLIALDAETGRPSEGFGARRRRGSARGRRGRLAQGRVRGQLAAGDLPGPRHHGDARAGVPRAGARGRRARLRRRARARSPGGSTPCRGRASPAMKRGWARAGRTAPAQTCGR